MRRWRRYQRNFLDAARLLFCGGTLIDPLIDPLLTPFDYPLLEHTRPSQGHAAIICVGSTMPSADAKNACACVLIGANPADVFCSPIGDWI